MDVSVALNNIMEKYNADEVVNFSVGPKSNLLLRQLHFLQANSLYPYELARNSFLRISIKAQRFFLSFISSKIKGSFFGLRVSLNKYSGLYSKPAPISKEKNV